MLLGRVGLAKMSADMRERIRSAGDEVTGHGHTSNTRDVASLEKLVAALPTPRIVWVMVSSAAATTETLPAMGDLLSQGEVAVYGGSSTFTDDIMHAQELQAKGIGFADCGASGGLWGQENGYGLMCGADARHVQMAMPIFDAPRPKSPRDEFGGHVVTQAGESCVLTHH